MSIEHIVKRLNESRNTMTPEMMDVASEIQQAVQKEVTSYMESEGFPPEEVKDYTRVDTTFREGMLVIEVGAEVSYEGLMNLCDKLNPIVSHYDKEAYFEPITSGIIGAWLRPEEITKEDVEESVEAQEAEYICKSIKVDNSGVMEIVCYDTVEDEDFEKYIGQVDSLSAQKAAHMLLKDWKFDVPKDIKNELIGTFGLEDFGYKIEESSEQEYKEFPTEDEAYEYAKEFGYTINKIQSGHGDKACMCWMTPNVDSKG